ncbi:MAG TPA: GntR family transcriptional regulator [Ktedonobacterales bacterium]|nr:GntR family transcriptional regulator [Ktedonobacterales bacterium]
MAERMETEPLLIRLDEINPQPKYLQIVEQVRTFAAEGKLTPGTRLPSVRQLASDLGINVNTVLTAYHALEAEEIILLRHGSRAVIHPRLTRPATPQESDVAHIRALLARVRTDALLRGLSLPMLQQLSAEVFRSTPPERAPESSPPQGRN